MTPFLHRLHVRLLAMFRPVSLFQRINRLPWYRDTLRAWVDALDTRGGDEVLEVGCASGSLARYLARQGLRVSAADRSAAMLRRALVEGGGVDYRQADIVALPYDSDRFARVVAASIVNVVDRPQAAIDELARVCRQEGRVSVLLPSADWDTAGVAGLLNGLGLKGFSAAALFMWNALATKMDGAEVQRMFRQAGLEDIRVVDYLHGMLIGVSGTKSHPRPVS